MRMFLIFTLLIHANVAFAQQSSVTLENVQAEYKSLVEVKPVVANGWDEPIYLLPKECGEAQVAFDNGGFWWGSDLYECPQITNPIEIKPGEIYHIPSLVIRFEQGEGKFDEERQGGPGKYMIYISYSLNPTYRNGRPELRYSLTKEFSIVK